MSDPGSASVAPGAFLHTLGPQGFAMRLEAVVLPELGTDPDEPIVVSHWFVSRGEEVWEGDRLVELLVGPATFDVSAPRSGRLAEIRGLEDDRVCPGTVLGMLAVRDDGPSGGGPPQADANRRPRS